MEKKSNLTHTSSTVAAITQAIIPGIVQSCVTVPLKFIARYARFIAR